MFKITKNPRGEINFEKKSKKIKYVIIPTWYALGEIERILKKTFIKLLNNLKNNELTINELLVIIWCGFFRKKTAIDEWINTMNKEELKIDLLKIGLISCYEIVSEFFLEYIHPATSI